jgi:phosphoserine phosphatase
MPSTEYNMVIGDKVNHAAAFFDLDLTITDRDSFRYFLKKHYFQKLWNWGFIPQIILSGLRRKIRSISLQTFKEKALVSLRGKDAAHIAKIGRHFFENHLQGIIREKALERITWHKRREHPLFIVTSCPDIYITQLSGLKISKNHLVL